MSAGATTDATSDPTIAIDPQSGSAVRRARLRDGAAKANVDGPIAWRCVKALFRLVRRFAVAEAIVLATATLCTLLGFPAVVTAFFVSLTSLVANCVCALLTLMPLCRKRWSGGAG